MEASEMLIMVLCNPDGDVCIGGSIEDKCILEDAIRKVKELESRLTRHF